MHNCLWQHHVWHLYDCWWVWWQQWQCGWQLCCRLWSMLHVPSQLWHHHKHKQGELLHLTDLELMPCQTCYIQCCFSELHLSTGLYLLSYTNNLFFLWNFAIHIRRTQNILLQLQRPQPVPTPLKGFVTVRSFCLVGGSACLSVCLLVSILLPNCRMDPDQTWHWPLPGPWDCPSHTFWGCPHHINLGNFKILETFPYCSEKNDLNFQIQII